MAMPAQLARYWRSKGRKVGSKKSSKRGARMAKSGGHRPKKQLPLAIIIGFTPLLAKGISDVRTGGFSGLANTVSCLVPYDVASRKVSFANLHLGLWPIIAGFLVHKIVGGYFGLNRQLARVGIPLIRI